MCEKYEQRHLCQKCLFQKNKQFSDDSRGMKYWRIEREKDTFIPINISFQIKRNFMIGTTSLE